MINQEYFLGLDIGTDSVGWAAANSEYHIIKKNGKALWGVRLFDSAQTAAERREYRIARRRIERRKQRLAWLQDQFAAEIAKKDPAFFRRLQESKFLEEDKQSNHPLGRYTLFADRNYCDKDYYRDYPTVYHLRKKLMEQPGPFDVRLVYLALHHIMKYRGHFLYGDLAMDSISLKAGMDRLNHVLEQEFEYKLEVSNMEALKEVLISRKGSKTWRKKCLAELLSVDKREDQMGFALAELLAGSSVPLDALFGDGTATEDFKKISLEDDFEEIVPKLEATLGDRIEVVLAAKGIHDWALLETMRDGERYISSAKVKSYQKHEDDLTLLKTVVRQLNDRDMYREIFHTAREKLNNYPAYSGKDANGCRCGYDDFRKYLTGKLKPYKDLYSDIPAILSEFEQGTFLPLQTTKDNGVIPHQLHEEELVKILGNASAYLPFLTQVDESGLTKAEQIHRMFCFRIPYYVGPLDSRSEHSWVVRKNDKVYPWNFEQVVDLEACRRNFIERMTRKCSYIGEPVLPQNSLLYTRFQVLNELNNLKVNGEGISVAQKQAIYHDLCLSGKKVSLSKLRNYLNLDKNDEITGIDGDLKGTLSPWKHYAWLIKQPGGYEITEDIIRQITLFGDDRKLLANWLHKTYGNKLTREEEKLALRFQCSGWGRLSRAFLTEIYHGESSTGEAMSIMDMLWETNYNLMELLSSRFDFAGAVQAYREAHLNQYMSLQDYLDESYASPGIKRAIHQVMGIVNELEGILKCPPKRVFVEVAREHGEKGKRTISRKNELLALYQKCGEECDELFQQLSDEPEGNLRRDKLYLYYTQKGRCMYSGEPINLSELDSGYDIDHIYPQSKTKDDSIQNRVLVKRELNAVKSDNYPIAADIRMKMRPFWTKLERAGLISKEKYHRLTRSTEFSAEEQAGFISRQLVETRQSSKIVAELLKQRFGSHTEIVYVKAGNVSSFRQDQRLTKDGQQKQAGQCKQNEQTVQDPLFVKCREVNDFHHAKDAYLNIVVGNVYHVKFTRNPANFLREKNAKFSLSRMFDFDVSRGEDVAWRAGPEGSIAIVRHTMRKNNILFTRRSAEATGGLFDQMIVPKGKGQAPVKASDPRMSIEKFGGYNKLTGAYFILVEHTAKKKRVRSLETVLLMYKEKYEAAPETYCCEILGLQEPKVLIPRIKINTLVSYDGFRMHISGRTGDRIIYKNANQLVMPPDWQQYIKNISKYLERCRTAGRELELTTFDGITDEANLTLYRLLLEKLENGRYRVKYETPAQTLCSCSEKFRRLSVPDQCRILMQILNLFANTAASADLKLLNGKAGIGILLTSKNLDNYRGHSFKLIHQSITGFFEQEIDLMGEMLS